MRLLTLLRIAILTALGSVLLISSDTQSGTRFACNNPTHEDYDALMALYNSTDGPNWTNNDGWGEDCDVCGWYGIGCLNDRVSHLDLSNNNLIGNVPSEIGDLATLEIFRLHRNELTGEIPSEVSKLIQLREFQIGQNNLVGGFPAEIFSFPELLDLRISDAGLSGPIPDLFGSVPLLRTLEISKNDFDGELPTSVYSLENLGNLSFANTGISGGFKDLFAGLPSLWTLNAINTKIGGSLPPSIGQAKSLTSINLSNCELEGVIPESIYTLPEISTINLSTNNLTGGISSNIGNLATLKNLTLNTNQDLGGSIPSSIGSCLALENFAIQRCNITGGVPNEFYNLINIRQINLANNPLGGSLSNQLCNLQEVVSLNISFAFLEGSIPKCLSTMHSLRFINLSNNLLSGDLEGLFNSDMEIVNLTLNDNRFTGDFPSDLAMVPNLNRIGLNRNYLVGCIPASYSIFCNLDFAVFSQNCTFANPTFDEFCNGATCDNSLNLQSGDVQVCSGENIGIEAPTGYSGYAWSVPGETSATLTTTATESQYYYLTITNSRGCTKTDSIFIQVASSEPGFETASICPGGSVNVNGQDFTELGTFDQPIPRPGTCDSIVEVTITAKEPTTGTYTETICPGTTTSINGQDFAPGDHEQTIKNVEGCDSIITIFIAEHPTYTQDLTFTVCEGQTYNYQGTELNPGPHLIEDESIYGCDSTVNIQVNEILTTYETIEASFCEGKSVNVNNEEFDVEDTYTRTLTNAQECDSILTIIITERLPSSETVNLQFCKGGSIDYQGQTYSEVDDYSLTLTNEAGCDSFLTISVTEIAPEPTQLNEIICDGQSYEINNESYNTPGPHEITFKTEVGCDSIVTLALTIISGEDQTIIAATCAGDPYSFAGTDYYESTVVQDSVIVDGCKSLVTLNLMVLKPVYSEFDRTICEGDRTFFAGQFYDEEQSVTGEFKTASGCDSIVTMNLSIAEEKSTVIDTFLCEGTSLFINGFTFTGIDSRTFFLTTEESCDSNVTVNVDVYEMKTDTFQASVCEGSSYEFLDGESYTSGEHSGTYNDGNCQQNFFLTVVDVAKIKQNPTLNICQGGSVQFMGNIYSESGLYEINEDVGECEVVENLVILENSNETNSIPQIFCEGTVINIAGSQITTSGIYASNSSECAHEFVSVIFIAGNEIEINEVLEMGTAYNLNGESFTESGVYERVIGNEIGCPTSVTLNLEFQTCEGERMESLVICTGETVEFDDDELDETGVYMKRQPLEIGCDSIILLNLTVAEEVEFTIQGQDYLCPGEMMILSGPAGYEYLWNDGTSSQELQITKGGIYELTIFDTNNCASFASKVVEAIKFPESALDIAISDPSTCTATDGTISINTDDDKDYLYSIDGGNEWQAFAEFTGLPNGSYDIAIADGLLRCVKIIGDVVTLESSGVPQIETVEVTPINDCIGELGTIIIVPTNMDETYVYSINGGITWSGDGFFDDLGEGSYDVLMKVGDSECVNNLTESIDLKNIGNLSIQVEVLQEVSCSAVADGMTRVEIVDGQAPYTYIWTDGQNGALASSLTAGTYEVTVTDAHGCIQVEEVTLETVDIKDLIVAFENETLCENDTILYDVNPKFNYVLFKDDILYSEGTRPAITDVGEYQIVVENGDGCVADKRFRIDALDLSELGIDFLLATEGVVNVPVVAINISNPKLENLSWSLDAEGADVNELDRYSQGITFGDTGTYTISLLTEVDGCLASFEKQILIYPDSSYLGTYEPPDEPLDIARFINWEVLPNPNNGEFLVKVNVSNAFFPVRLRIYDIYGGLINNRRLLQRRSYTVPFNLEASGTGIYTVSVEYRDHSDAKQIMVIK